MESFKLSPTPSPEAPKETLAGVFKKHPIITTVLVLIILGTFGSMTGDVATDIVQEPVAPTVAEVQRDIVVTSQTVKMVDGKYRYFFDIRNNDDAPFTGQVNIYLREDSGSKLGQEKFQATAPIQPGMGDSVYIDMNTGPVPHYDPEFAITHYDFEVIEANQIVSIGNGNITSPTILERY